MNVATHLPSSSFRMGLPWAWRENDRVRREGSANLVEAARRAGVPRLVQESFGLIYESRGEEWIDESVPLRPARCNRTVLDAEESAARFTRGGGAGVVLRFAGFYGPDSYMLRDMIGLVRRGLGPLPGSPEAFFSSVSHDDAAAAVVAALELPAGTYNVVDDEPLRRREFFDAFAGVLGVRPPRILPGWTAPLFGALGEMLTRSLRISNRKLRAASAWAPRYRSAREGLRAAVAELAGASRQT